MLATLVIVTLASIGATVGFMLTRVPLGADAGLISALLAVFAAVYFSKPSVLKR